MRYFKKIINILIELLIPVVILALLIGVAKILIDLKGVFNAPRISQGLDLIIENILSLFILIELLKSIVEYFEIERLKITFIIDAAIVFVLREVMVGLYRHNIEYPTTLAMTGFLLVAGIIRTMAIKYSPDLTKEKKNEQ